MDFRGKVESFEEADSHYEELVRKREAGEISGADFDAESRQLMVREDGGRWWAKLGDSGEWHYRDGGDWVPGTPPGYEGDDIPGQSTDTERKMNDLRGADDGPGTEVASAMPRQPAGGKKRRRFPAWIPIAALLGVLLLLAVVAITALVPLFQGEESSSSGGEGMGVGQSQEAEGGAAGGGESGEAANGGQAEGGSGGGDVFVHRATSENISDNSTFIDNSLTNDNPDAILIVTQNWNPGGEGGTYNEHPIGVWYNADRGQWAVFNQDIEPMTEDAAFNVSVR